MQSISMGRSKPTAAPGFGAKPRRNPLGISEVGKKVGDALLGVGGVGLWGSSSNKGDFRTCRSVPQWKDQQGEDSWALIDIGQQIWWLSSRDSSRSLLSVLARRSKEFPSRKACPGPRVTGPGSPLPYSVIANLHLFTCHLLYSLPFLLSLLPVSPRE